MIIIALFISSCTRAQNQPKITGEQLEAPSAWVDSVFKTLSPDQKLGQLIMVTAYSHADRIQTERIAELIRYYHIGGVMMAQGGPQRQVNLVNYFQSIAHVPLLVSMDAEWGLSMRLDSTISFPRQMPLGAINDDKLIYEFGLEMARQLRRVGAHISFSPVLDINSNQWNPVISTRSFGSDKKQVAERALQYMKGLQDGGVLACAKHFPGHGDTDNDSHTSLPSLFRSKAALDSVELYPYKQLIPAGLCGVMIGHIGVPAYDASNSPSSQSYAISTSLLKNQLGFKGLVITDDLLMKGANGNFSSTESAVKSLIAGNDILLNPESVPATIYSIKTAISKGRLSWKEVDAKVKKVLAAKFLVGLNKNRLVSTKNVITDLKLDAAKYLNYELVKNSLTLVRNQKNLLPIIDVEKQKIGAVSIGAELDNAFLNTLAKYGPVSRYSVWMNDEEAEYEKLYQSLADMQTVIIGLHSIDTNVKDNFAISENARKLIVRLSKTSNIILAIFGNPYCITNFDYLPAILVAYDDNALAKSLAAQAVFGGIGLSGKLPVTVGVGFKKGDGVATKPTRLEYAMPEAVGIQLSDLNRIDSIAQDGVNKRAYPGCVVLVAKDGKVIYEKAFGYHSFENTVPDKVTDVFDLASVTKIAATTQGVMRLYEQGRIDLNSTLGSYVPVARGYDKSQLLIKDLMTHQAGLTPFIPFYKNLASGDYNYDSSATFPTRVAQNFYIRKGYFNNVMLPQMLASRLNAPGKYVYSDLSMYFMQQVVQEVSGQPLYTYLKTNFYKPLGLTTMGYNPRSFLSVNRLVPTENDRAFRHQVVTGDVHDQGAAMAGGVAGHAGLFSSANDLAVLMQMLLNEGEYGGLRYFQPETIKKFIVYQNPEISRRGLGFDKPEVSLAERSYGSTAKEVSDETFGHTGFTGTCVWVDPKYKLTYIFLSNRLMSAEDSNKLGGMSIRPKIHQVVYDAILKVERSAKQ
ncbi:glycoside hydrolase family 3 N-terminal domain-containing protein [Solitalea lacus]|uniref:glycoside hydrolase family 3 N-terminal domain-containing protein n=1 Tax=Solitalea lacus TaxID=2911172 RepID=UPI001ED9F256|nr:glycoside hydrolase family 3 N-terminal domain-containing protein [Solitalea lacus]UKJ08303.1 serine hydrolase [Solitalea lacus]